MGDVVNMAARLMCKKEQGVLIDETTRDLIPPGTFNFEQLGPYQFKGTLYLWFINLFTTLARHFKSCDCV